MRISHSADVRLNLLTIVVGKGSFAAGAIDNPAATNDAVWQTKRNNTTLAPLPITHEWRECHLKISDPRIFQAIPELVTDHPVEFCLMCLDLTQACRQQAQIAHD